ncbi:DUF4435 domain-containing protein [Salinisphaera shabanensis]|uniref:DUF4435 domain-containing protein n=1 Tax=Salinisphaera shabanensis TaxID=180542 RepID=UPI00137656A2|nr:DUF4435 domain-containing protein [Salinisphaera shabanensis]
MATTKAFSRTPAGLSNLPRFFKADLIFFVEGGKSNGSDAQSFYEQPNQSDDAVFWRAFAKRFFPNLSVHIAPRGRKLHLLDIAEKIESEAIRNVVIAIDLDYDWSNSDRVYPHCVITTYGYSWENDVCCTEHIFDLVADLFGNELPRHIGNEFHELISKYKPIFSRIGTIDNAMLTYHAHPLIEREKPGSVVVARKKGDQPELNFRGMCNNYRTARSAANGSVPVSKFQLIDGFSTLYGKVVLHFFYLTSSWLFQQLQLSSPRKDVFARQLSIHLFKSLDDIAHLHAHYSANAARVGLCIK